MNHFCLPFPFVLGFNENKICLAAPVAARKGSINIGDPDGRQEHLHWK